MVWHRDTAFPAVDLIVVPGGFSYGDYLRSGAMAAHSPVMRAVVDEAKRGVSVLGICNGFQILTEAGLLPGALVRNRSLKYICRAVPIDVENSATPFSYAYRARERIMLPIAHKDGSYTADDATLDRLEGEGLVVFRYAPDANPNGSARNIAGIINGSGRILGLMPHPERASDPQLGPEIDGRRIFESLMQTLH